MSNPATSIALLFGHHISIFCNTCFGYESLMRVQYLNAHMVHIVDLI